MDVKFYSPDDTDMTERLQHHIYNFGEASGAGQYGAPALYFPPCGTSIDHHMRRYNPASIFPCIGCFMLTCKILQYIILHIRFFHMIASKINQHHQEHLIDIRIEVLSVPPQTNTGLP